MNYISIVKGAQFGQLTVRQNRIKGESHILCKCLCGTIKPVNVSHLLKGKIVSCGCARANGRWAHGQGGGKQKRSPEYESWCGMWRRVKSNARYIAKGITVCKRWQSFENFFADMGKKPTAAHSIDRINNAGSYTPRNCRWATPTEQNRNRN